MNLLNSTGMAAGYTVALDKAGYEHVVVVVKGTFTLTRSGDGLPAPSCSRYPRVPRWAHHGAVSFRNGRTSRRGGLIPDNGIVERFRKAMLDAFYRIAFRK